MEHMAYRDRIAEQIGSIPMSRTVNPTADGDRRWLAARRRKIVPLLRERDGEICLWCNRPLDGFPLLEPGLHVDHIIPVSEGGEPILIICACCISSATLRKRIRG